MAKRFDRQLDKATDSTLIDPNWDAIIECVDLIRGGEVPVKIALASIRKRFHSENPHVAHHGLLVLEACVKNCGAKFHTEIATRDFMEDLKNLSLDSTPDKVKNKILELLQCWAKAFKNKPEYKIVVDTHNLMKLAGFDFPQVAEADAMFIAESAPEWADGQECFRCRTAFGLITRKHHCRACGLIFCDKCSSKQCFLPQYGIEKEVRVCDSCYEKTASKVKTSDTPSSGSNQKALKQTLDSSEKTVQERKHEMNVAEEEEINLAIALSQSEAEAQEQERQRQLCQIYNGPENNTNGVKIGSSLVDNSRATVRDFTYKGAADINDRVTPISTTNNESCIDPELAKYLNRDYWQQRKNEQKNGEWAKNVPNGNEHQKTPTPTAPPPSESSHSRSININDREVAASLCGISLASTTKQLEGDVTPSSHFGSPEEDETAEAMEFCRQLREQVTVMDNRIRSNIARNRSVVNDTGIQSLFIRLTEMHAQVMARMNKLEDQRNYFESMQDHLAHILEARQAVDALREDHVRQKQEHALEMQRIKQLQMQQKVDLMRQKKHELILHQRHMALLRFQQQEQEMQMKRMQMSKAMHNIGNQPACIVENTNPTLQASSAPAYLYQKFVQTDPTFSSTLPMNCVETSQQPNFIHYSMPTQEQYTMQSQIFNAPNLAHGQNFVPNHGVTNPQQQQGVNANNAAWMTGQSHVPQHVVDTSNSMYNTQRNTMKQYHEACTFPDQPSVGGQCSITQCFLPVVAPSASYLAADVSSQQVHSSQRSLQNAVADHTSTQPSDELLISFD